MRIDRLNVYPVRLPFRETFAISRLAGRSSRSVVVEAVAEGGRLRGFGEGIPVFFVTGETPAATVASLRDFAARPDFPWRPTDGRQVARFVGRLPPGRRHNAAVCALECALLDLLGRRTGLPAAAFFPQRHRVAQIRYGAPLTLADPATTRRRARAIRRMGIRQLRVKMDRDLDRNRKTLEIVSEIWGNDCRLCADPNGVWDLGLALAHLPLLVRHGVRSLEEPLPPGDPALPELAGRLHRAGIGLMACESAPTPAAVEGVIRGGLHDVVNVKLSRSGGFHRCLAIVSRLRSAGLEYRVGCTLGESGILSAAGRTLGLLCGDARSWDGSYDRFLLAENITRQHVGFGPGGRAGPLPGPGLGVTVDRRRLGRLAPRRYTFHRPGNAAGGDSRKGDPV